MTGMEALLGYLISLAASLRGNAIQEGREQKLLQKLQEEAQYFQNVESMRPLREEVDRVGINIARIKAQLEVAEDDDPIFSLIEDPIFVDDLTKWILAADGEEELNQRQILSRHFLAALQANDPAPAEIEKFAEEFLQIVEKQVFSNQILNNWRADIRMRAIQSAVSEEGQATRATVDAGVKEIIGHLSPLIKTTADDIRTLRLFTENTVNHHTRVSSIVYGEDEIKLERNVVTKLYNAVFGGSALVVGEPGAGKSIALLDLARMLRSAGFEAILIDVQQLQSGSLGNLRNELGLNYEIIEVFKDWPGRDPAFLLIDTLDAARSDQSSGMIRQLIQEVSELERWNVAASVRKFDLRYALDIQSVFQGPPPSEPFSDQEFLAIRHINIPLFDDNELGEISQHGGALGNLISSAGQEFLALIRVPFNLRLAAETLQSGVDSAELFPIKTQIELLDRYWHARVLQADARGDAREAVAFKAAKEMVKHRSLTIPRTIVSDDPSASEPLHQLLSTNVLAEWSPPGGEHDRYTLEFSHNITFDFAAERALFGGQPDAINELLAGEPDLLLAIRPSAVFHFRRLWAQSADHTSFWMTVFNAVQMEELPKISQLIGPSVAVELTEDISDVSPLIDALRGGDANLRAAAGETVKHIAGALMAKNTQLVGENAGPWLELLEVVSENIDQQTAGAIRNLLLRCFVD